MKKVLLSVLSSLLITSVKAEVTSLLSKATVLTDNIFTEITVDPIVFIQKSFKSRIVAKKIEGQEMQIITDFGSAYEQQQIKLVYLGNYCNDFENLAPMSGTEIWIGDDLKELRLVKSGISTTGFYQLDNNAKGKYLAIRKSTEQPFYILNSMRVYQTPNLLQKIDYVYMTARTSSGLPGFSADNLLMFLEQRSCGNGQRAVLNEKGTVADYESCFKTNEKIMKQDESGDFLVIGVDLGSEHTISSILIVEDMREGNAWTRSENDAVSHLENVHVIIGNEQIATEFGQNDE